MRKSVYVPNFGIEIPVKILGLEQLAWVGRAILINIIYNF